MSVLCVEHPGVCPQAFQFRIEIDRHLLRKQDRSVEVHLEVFSFFQAHSSAIFGCERRVGVHKLDALLSWPHVNEVVNSNLLDRGPVDVAFELKISDFYPAVRPRCVYVVLFLVFDFGVFAQVPLHVLDVKEVELIVVERDQPAMLVHVFVVPILPLELPDVREKLVVVIIYSEAKHHGGRYIVGVKFVLH